MEKIKEPVKIVFVSDLHLGGLKSREHLEKIAQKIKTLNPDFILLGGDQFENDVDVEKGKKQLGPMAELASLFPVYAVPGNHEYGISGGKSIANPRYRTANISKESKRALEDIHVNYLVNNIAKLEAKNGEGFYLFGGTEYWTGNLDFSTLNQKKDNLPVLALIHNPTAIFAASQYPIDLMLSGHTHGGQIRLPFIGPLGWIDNILPTKWYQGLHEYKGIKLFVSSGAGETGARARLFNPPEVVLLTLQ